MPSSELLPKTLGGRLCYTRSVFRLPEVVSTLFVCQPCLPGLEEMLVFVPGGPHVTTCFMSRSCVDDRIHTLHIKIVFRLGWWEGLCALYTICSAHCTLWHALCTAYCEDTCVGCFSVYFHFYLVQLAKIHKKTTMSHSIQIRSSPTRGHTFALWLGTFSEVAGVGVLGLLTAHPVRSEWIQKAGREIFLKLFACVKTSLNGKRTP